MEIVKKENATGIWLKYSMDGDCISNRALVNALIFNMSNRKVNRTEGYFDGWAQKWTQAQGQNLLILLLPADRHECNELDGVRFTHHEGFLLPPHPTSSQNKLSVSMITHVQYSTYPHNNKRSETHTSTISMPRSNGIISLFGSGMWMLYYVRQNR